MVRIPVEYQEVEYIESTGTQYFWTDINIQDNLTVDSVQTFISGDSYLFGGDIDLASNSKICFNGYYNKKVQAAYPSKYYTYGNVNNDNKTVYHLVSTHANGRRLCYVNDEKIYDYSGYGTTRSSDAKCICFGFNRAGTPRNFYIGKVYSIKVSQDNVILANFIPCYRKSDDEIGMYDTVTGTFFTNQGTGTFLKGNDVTYDPINLLEIRRRILLNTLQH